MKAKYLHKMAGEMREKKFVKNIDFKINTSNMISSYILQPLVKLTLVLATWLYANVSHE
jgi:hypothetical protein